MSIGLSPGSCAECCGDVCRICATVTDCFSTPISGATVTVKQAGSTVGTCTTDAAGKCCVDVPASGSYNVAASKAGYVGQNVDVSVSCPETKNVALTMRTTGTAHRFFASGCGSLGLPGVTLTIGGGSYTTDASGFAYYSLPPGTYSWTATPPTGFDAKSGSQSHTCLQSLWGQPFTVSSGYVCTCGGCVLPMQKTSVTLTDSIIGTVTLNWDATAGAFKGTKTGYSFPGYCGCPPNTTDIEYTFTPGTAGCSLGVRYYACAGNPLITTGYCPGTLPYGSCGMLGPSITFTAPSVSCPSGFSWQASFTDKCVCNGGFTDCTNGYQNIRLWGNAIPTFTVTQ